MRTSLKLTLRAAAAFLFCAMWVPPACAQLSGNPSWLLGGHGSVVNCVTFSPDGTILASASDDATVKLWSTNGALLKTLGTQPYQANAVAFSPDGTRLAIGTEAYLHTGSTTGNSGYSLLQLWQTTGGWAANANLSRMMTNKYGKVSCVAFSADGTRLASGTASGSNYIWNVSDGTLLKSCFSYTTNKMLTNSANLQICAPTLALAYSASGLLASGCEDGSIKVWNSSYSQIWTNSTAHGSNVTALAFSPGGGLLASASLDQTICLWSTANWSLSKTLTGSASGVTSVAFSPDGNSLVSGSGDGSIRFWNVANGSCTMTIPAAHADSVTSVAFSPNGALVASGGRDNAVKLWSAAGGSLLQKFGGHSDYVKISAISPDGTLAASASNDKCVQVRRLSDGALVQVLPGNTDLVSAVAFTPDSAALATGGGPLDPTIKLWRISDGALLDTIPATTNGVMALAFSPDGSEMASGGDFTEQTIKLWRTSDGALLQTFAGHSNGVTALAFSPNGDLLASGGRRWDNAVKVWALTNGTLLRAFSGQSNNVTAVAFAEDSDTLASCAASGTSTNFPAGTNNLMVWRVSDGSSRNFGNFSNTVWAVAFSPDGSTLASASQDAISLWNVGSGALSQTITQEAFRVSCLVYSPNGNLLLCGRQDATVVLSTNILGALGQPRLAFNSITRDAGGSRINAAVQPKAHYVVQSSSNLTDWAWLTLAVSRSNSLSISDPTTNAPSQFYRAITPP